MPQQNSYWDYISKLGFGTASQPSVTQSQTSVPVRPKTVIEQSFSDVWAGFREPVVALRNPLYWIQKMFSMGLLAWDYQTKRYPSFVRWLTLPFVAFIGVVLLTKLFVSLAVFYLAAFLPILGLQALQKATSSKSGNTESSAEVHPEASDAQRMLDDTLLRITLNDIAASAKTFWRKLTEKLPEQGKFPSVLSRIIVVMDGLKKFVIEPIFLALIPLVLTAAFAAVVGLICAPLEIKDWLVRTRNNQNASASESAANDEVMSQKKEVVVPPEVGQGNSPINTGEDTPSMLTFDFLKGLR